MQWIKRNMQDIKMKKLFIIRFYVDNEEKSKAMMRCI